MKLKRYAAISLTEICATFISFGGTEEQFESFVNTVLECAYTWGDAAHTLVSLEGFIGNLAGEDETVWPRDAWKRLYASLTVFAEGPTPVYVDLET